MRSTVRSYIAAIHGWVNKMSPGIGSMGRLKGGEGGMQRNEWGESFGSDVGLNEGLQAQRARGQRRKGWRGLVIKGVHEGPRGGGWG